MAQVVIMPRQGQSVESCVITKWEKQVGEKVHVGDILFTYETDKASFEEEAKTDGILLAVFFDEQDDVPCLTEVAVIGEPGEDISSFGPKAGHKEEEPKTEAPAAEEKDISAAAVSDDRPCAAASGVSPRARETAKRLNVNLNAVKPTGPHGRIIERDVLAAGRSTSAAIKAEVDSEAEGTGLGGRVTLADIKTPDAVQQPETGRPLGYHDEKIPHIRKVIAKSMHNSLANMAQLTNHTSFDATDIMAYRKALKAAPQEELQGITYNDFIIYAVSRVIKNYPELNAHLLDDRMRYFDHVHIGMAVDTPRGLLVPTICNADEKSLLKISQEAQKLAAAARSGSINPDLLSGASFTISNLGSLGVEMFTPIINPPQTGILGVDCMIDRVRVEDGQIKAYKAMGISLTYDHRAIDGAPASRFLKELKNALENFTLLLAK